MVRGFLETHNFRLKDVLEKIGFERNKSIDDAKEIINKNDETRKRFEIMAREVFKKFKACINIKSASKYREQYDAINIIYNRLQIDREQADITDIIRQLHAVVDAAIEIPQNQTADPDTEKDRATIEKTFEELKDIERIKNVAKDLLEHLKADKLILDNWREKEATRDSIKIEIHNRLYNDATGLPESYTEDEISQKTDIVFAHIFRLYNTANPEIYEVA